MHFISDLDSILVQERNCVEMVAQWYRAGCCSAVQLSRVQIPVSLISTYMYIAPGSLGNTEPANNPVPCDGPWAVFRIRTRFIRFRVLVSVQSFSFPRNKIFIIFYYTGWIVKKWWIQKNSISVSCQKKSMEICVSSTNYTV